MDPSLPVSSIFEAKKEREREKDQSSGISRLERRLGRTLVSKYPKRCPINSRLRAVEKVEPTLKKVTLWRDVLGERRAGA